MTTCRVASYPSTMLRMVPLPIFDGEANHKATAVRTVSDPTRNSTIGTDLGAGPGAGRTKVLAADAESEVRGASAAGCAPRSTTQPNRPRVPR